MPLHMQFPQPETPSLPCMPKHYLAFNTTLNVITLPLPLHIPLSGTYSRSLQLFKNKSVFPCKSMTSLRAMVLFIFVSLGPRSFGVKQASKIINGSIHKKTCIQMSIAALYRITKKLIQPTCLSTDEQINKCGLSI